MSIVTDSGEGIPKNVYAIHNLFRPASELLPLYESKASKYKELKEILIEDIEKFTAPLREKRKELAKNIPKAFSILEAGGKKQKRLLQEKWKKCEKKLGLKFIRNILIFLC